MVFIEETFPTLQPESGKGDMRTMSEGNEAQVLFVLLLTMRNIIDTVIYDNPKYYTEAISGPNGPMFKELLDLLDRTDDKISEYCLFVLRSDRPGDVLSEFRKVQAAIDRIFTKVITTTGSENPGDEE